MNNIQILYEKCIKIKNLGWIKADKIQKGTSGILFEKLLEINPGNFEIPDFYDIEIKVKNNNPINTITLFSATPDSYLFEIKRLRQDYGFPDKNFPIYNVLHSTVYSTKLVRVSNKYYFKLTIDYNKKRVILIVFNNILNIIDRRTSWSFDMLKEKLERKLNNLCLVTSNKKIENNELYFKYEKFDFYKLKDFDTFIKLIEDGIIRINFNIGIYKDEKNLGKTFDHGTSFVIPRYAISKLFTKINMTNIN